MFLGTHYVHRGVAGFARLNMILVVIAMVIAWLLLREHRRLTAPASAAPVAAVKGRGTPKYGMVMDTRKCIGCMACVAACKNASAALFTSAAGLAPSKLSAPAV